MKLVGMQDTRTDHEEKIITYSASHGSCITLFLIISCLQMTKRLEART